MVRGLRKNYGGRAVVDGLDLDVFAGEIVGLIGANDTGKTTTVECMRGLRRPEAGMLRVLGLTPLATRRPGARLMGSQLQSSGLPDRLRVEEAVRLFSGGEGGTCSTSSGWPTVGVPRSRPSAAASDSGCSWSWRSSTVPGWSFSTSSPRAWTRRPDARCGRRSTSCAAGGTVLLVTHELDEAEGLCDRVVAMRAGRALDSGSPAALVDRYGRSATVTFTLAGGPRADALTGLPPWTVSRCRPARRRSPGIGRPSPRSAPSGEVGLVPPDLSVRVPRLEDALIDLLEAAADRIPSNLGPAARNWNRWSIAMNTPSAAWCGPS